MKKIVIDPRVIKHLGRDLITSPEVAVIELVKNSIDAKAKHINLRLYNNYSHNESLPNYVRAAIPKQYLDLPMLIVEDDGRGMTNAALDDGFLKIATDIKYGTPLPIILNFFDKQSVGSTRNFLGKD